MDKETSELLEKSAAFIEEASIKLAEYDRRKASHDAMIVKQAVETAGVLVNRGIIAEEKKAEMTDSLIADPSKIFDITRKLANIAGQAPQLGVKAAEVSGGKLDAFERWAVYGHPHATGVSSGNIL